MKFKLLISLLSIFIIFVHAHAEQGDADISFYTGTFDIIDKEGTIKLLYLELNTKIQTYLEILFLESSNLLLELL